MLSSSSKFDSGCGWPAFSSSMGTAVKREHKPDGHYPEIVCANCGGHLGLHDIVFISLLKLIEFQDTSFRVNDTNTKMAVQSKNAIALILCRFNSRKIHHEQELIFLCQQKK